MKKALVVGINNYPGDPLTGCVNDANAMAAVLKSARYGYDVTSLLDEAATRVAVRRAISEVFTDATEVIIYFAGHGERTELATVLSTVDGVEHDEGVEVEFLRKILDARGGKAKMVMIVLDCCHSGGASPRARNAPRMTPRDLQEAIPLNAEGRVLLAACGAAQQAFETDDGAHGTFTEHLIAGLNGAAADRNGTVTIPTLYEFLSATFELNAQQTPAFRGDISGRIVLATGFKAGGATSVPPAQLQNIAILVDEAKQLLSEYHTKTQRPIEEWHTTGHRQACDLLAPILGWFDRKAAQTPGLATNKDFLQQRDAAHARLQTLASLEIGMETRHGRIEEYLGGGTFGSVYRLKKPTGESTVLKVYHPHDLRDVEKRIRFRRGYDAMRQLDHPHIVHVGEFSECPVAFTMDYVEGSNLRRFKGSTTEPDDLLRILLLTAETLQHAHGRGVVHRDVKPENIIIRWEEDGGWTPYLTDFDLAWFKAATQVTREAMGTLFYASPEQLNKPRATIARATTTDIFSFGQLLYYVITGSDPMPLGHPDNSRALAERMDARYTEQAARVIVDLYDACTEEDPDDRIPSFRRVCEKLFKTRRFLSKQDINARLPTSRFLSELRFAVVGLTPSSVSQESFVSLSRRVRISLSPHDLSDGRLRIQAHFAFEQQAAMPGLTNEAMRATLNARVTDALKGFDEATRKSGKQGAFEVYVEISNVLPSLAFVARCRKIITRVTDALERP